MVDLIIRSGLIEAIVDAGTPVDSQTQSIDAGGGLLVPPLVDSHSHLDKTLWGLPWRAHTGAPGVATMVANEHTNRRGLPPVATRAASLLDAYASHGVFHVRSHVDVDPEIGLDSIHGVMEAAERFAGIVDVQIVAFPQSGMLIAPPTLDLMSSAVASGVRVLGGLDPASWDRDPKAYLDSLFNLADRHQCAIDIHLHSRGELGAFEIEEVVTRTAALGMAGHVNISHGFCLSTVSDDRAARLAEALGAQRMTVTTVAAGGVPALPLKRLREAGVVVGLGQDGVRDLWSPFGNGDLLERAMMLAWQAGYRRDEDLQLALEAATVAGAHILGLDDFGVRIGGEANFVVLPVTTEAEAIVSHPPRTLLIRGGRTISP
jgi:cytosine/creatinine deaminase